MRAMGNLRKYMPITYYCFFIGALALSAIPPFSGFYSKDAIIEAIKESVIPGSHYAYICVLIGSFVTALYIFRAFFLTFHTQERFDEETRHHLHESPISVWIPLVLLAIPSIVIGAPMIKPMLFSSTNQLLGNAVFVLPTHDVLQKLSPEFEGPFHMILEAVFTWPFWFAVTGILVAWLSYIKFPYMPAMMSSRFSAGYKILVKKYGFDEFYQLVFVRGLRNVAGWLYRVLDMKVVDGVFVNGSGKLIAWFSSVTRKLQSGYLYHYAFAMIIGLLVFLAWLVLSS
jgi:NADH-quinone oxidoreductase subunit L